MEKTTNIWSRLRHGYGNASAALSNLSIHGEHDGDTEYDTVVHQALTRFYQQRDGGVPPWLETPQSQQQNVQRPQYNQTQSTSAAGNSSVHRTATARGGNALEDIYKRREQRQQQFQQQQMQSSAPPGRNDPQTPNRMPPRAQTFNLGDQSSAASQTSRGNDRFRNKLKSAGRANW